MSRNPSDFNPIVANLLAKPIAQRPVCEDDSPKGRILWIFSDHGLAVLVTIGLTVMLAILLLHPDKPVLPWYCVLAWTALCLYVGRMCIKSSPMLIAPLLFVLYFFVGYPLKIVYGQLSPKLFPLLSTGLYFARKSPKLDTEIMLAAIAGLLGIVLAVRIALFIRAERLRKKLDPPVGHSRSAGLPDRQALVLAICALVIFIPLLYAFMWRYRIGQTGVRAVVLPYRLSGIAVQMRAVFVPMMEVYLFWQVLKLRSRSLLWAVTAVIVAEALLCGFLSMSRGAVVARVIVFAVLSAKIYKELPSRMLIKAIIGGTFILLLHVFVIVPSITTFRVYSWRGHSPGSAMQAALAHSLHAGDYAARFNFIFGRMLGVEDLMGVAAYGDKNFSLMCDALTSGRGMRFVNYNMFGLRQFAGKQLGGTTFSGRGMSIIGYLYLSGSMFIVMAGSAGICLLICLVEIYLDRISLPASAVWVTITVPGIWEGAFRPLFYGVAILILSSWFLVRALDPWLHRWARRSLFIRRAQPRIRPVFPT